MISTAAADIRPTIPGLIVAGGIQPMSQRLDPLAPDIEVCHDARGELLAYCRTANGVLHVCMPDVASFSHVPGAGHVRAIPHRALTPEFILDTYHHCVLPLILPALGTQVLHASALAGTGGVVAFCASSGTGKSTIAAALGRRGYEVWADDAVAVDTAGSQPAALPLPFTTRLRPDAAWFLDCQGGPAAEVGQVKAGPVPLAALCVLRWMPDAAAPVTIERLDPAAACHATLTHAYCFSARDRGQRRRTIRDYLALTARVPVYDVAFRPGLERLPVILDAVEDIIGCVSMGKE
jgi:hypothetical protein